MQRIGSVIMNETIKKFIRIRYLCFVSALIICICAGFGYSWSVLQSPLIAEHNWSQSSVSLTYTITVVCSTMAPLLFGSIINKIPTRISVIIGATCFASGLICTGFISSGVWQLYLFYGVLSGIGCGFIYPTMMAYVVKLFPERPGMASGLGTASYGSGAIIWAPIAVALTNSFNISKAFIILGISFFIIICIGSIFIKNTPEDFGEVMSPKKESTGTESTGFKNLRRGEMVKTGSFYIMVSMFTCGLVAGVIIISQASPILQQTLKYSPAQAAVFVSVFAACNMAGRFICGSVSDKIGFNKTIIFIFALCGISMITLATTSADKLIIVSMGLAASCYGGFASLITPMTSKVFGSKYITENFGVMYVVFGLASFIGPNLAVYFNTSSGGSYTGAYLTATGIAMLGLILSIILNKIINPKIIKEEYTKIT